VSAPGTATGIAPASGRARRRSEHADQQRAAVYSDLFRAIEEAGVDVNNRKAALRTWCGAFAINDDAPVGPELGAEFELRLRQHRDNLQEDGAAASTVRSSASRMRAVRQIADLLRSSGPKRTAFAAALDAACVASGLRGVDIASVAAILPDTLTEWRSGRQTPNRLRRPAIERLEVALELQSGALVGLLMSLSNRRPSVHGIWHRAHRRVRAFRPFGTRGRARDGNLRRRTAPVVHAVVGAGRGHPRPRRARA
jgi:hypothetical protein